MPFDGFADPTGKFWKELAKHQTREWFKDNKARYEREWETPVRELLGEVRAGVDAAYAYCDLDEPKLFRIYRDVRFGKDKSPYKTHIGGTISVRGAGGVMDKPVALYLQLGAEPFAGAGHYMMAKDKLDKLRKAIVDPASGKELAKITRTLARRGYTFDAHETLVRVPKGFDPEHPLADFLRMKGLVARLPPLPALPALGKKGAGKALRAWLVTECKAVSALITWTTYATA